MASSDFKVFETGHHCIPLLATSHSLPAALADFKKTQDDLVSKLQSGQKRLEADFQALDGLVQVKTTCQAVLLSRHGAGAQIPARGARALAINDGRPGAESQERRKPEV